jgi:hypothetical protein
VPPNANLPFPTTSSQAGSISRNSDSEMFLAAASGVYLISFQVPIVEGDAALGLLFGGSSIIAGSAAGRTNPRSQVTQTLVAQLSSGTLAVFNAGSSSITITPTVTPNLINANFSVAKSLKISDGTQLGAGVVRAFFAVFTVAPPGAAGSARGCCQLGAVQRQPRLKLILGEIAETPNKQTIICESSPVLGVSLKSRGCKTGAGPDEDQRERRAVPLCPTGGAPCQCDDY